MLVNVRARRTPRAPDARLCVGIKTYYSWILVKLIVRQLRAITSRIRRAVDVSSVDRGLCLNELRDDARVLVVRLLLRFKHCDHPRETRRSSQRRRRSRKLRLEFILFYFLFFFIGGNFDDISTSSCIVLVTREEQIFIRRSLQRQIVCFEER